MNYCGPALPEMPTARPPAALMAPAICLLSLPQSTISTTWGDLYAESGQTLQGSFSAVSKPNLQENNKY